MESGDASDKEAPPTNPKKREPMRNTWLQVISMLVVMNTEDSLKQGSAMAITKRFNMACSIIYRLWEHAECMHAMAIINSPKLILRGEFQEAAYLSDRVCSRGCQESAAKEEMYPAITGNVDGSVKNHSALLDCCINHLCSL